MPHSSTGLAAKVLQTARKSISHWGVTTIEDVTAQVRQPNGAAVDSGFVTKVLKTQDDFEWLDEMAGWFWLRFAKRNSLLTQIEKVLSVAPRIPISELRVGVSRHHRREGFAPPQRVLLALCQRLPGCRIEENAVCAERPLKWEETLADTERTLAGVLKEQGPIMGRQRLEELCLERGIKRDTFYIHLTYSPVIERFAQGVYGLRGSTVQPGLAESLTTPRSRTKLVRDFGWMDDGKIRVLYKLSKKVDVLSTPHSALSSFEEERENYFVGWLPRVSRSEPDAPPSNPGLFSFARLEHQRLSAFISGSTLCGLCVSVSLR